MMRHFFPALSLRAKLFFVSLILLVIPVVGFQLSEQIKRDLLENQQQTLMFFARSVAAVLASQPEILSKERLHPDVSSAVYMPPLHHPIRLNAKLDDWPEIDTMAEMLAADHLLAGTEDYDVNSFHALHMTGERDNYIYAFFKVVDDKVIYRGDNSLWMDRSDHLQVHIEDKDGVLRQYQISPRQPGWVNGYLYDDFGAATIERNIQGVWEENSDGYTVEIRLPRNMVGNKLAFALVDVDDEKSRKIKYIINPSKKYKNSKKYYYDNNVKSEKNIENIEDIESINTIQNPGWIIGPSTTIQSILKTLARPDFRISIIDANSRIRATAGSLTDTFSQSKSDAGGAMRISQYLGRLLAPLYRLFTKPFSDGAISDPAPLSSFSLDGAKKALKGEDNFSRYTIDFGKENGFVEMMVATVPLQNETTIVGAVAIEQTTNSIIAMQNRVIEETITVAIFVFIFGGGALFLFAFYLSARIRKISRDAAGAITSSGQICPVMPMSSGDEIGELSRTLAKMLGQLKAQTDFREKMADNLEHELRTPLMGISSSLKNLAKELETQPEAVRQYIDWTQASVARLEALLGDIRDATTLQEMLAGDQKEQFSLNKAMEAWLTHHWQLAFADADFIYHPPDEEIYFYGDPQRILQLLDKLVENAVSFHLPQTPVVIGLEKTEKIITLAVSNTGPAIDEELQGQIFHSMVSSRSKGSGKDDKPHLGLGLFIVRTIAEAYDGSVRVESLPKKSQTTFYVDLPIKPINCGK